MTYQEARCINNRKKITKKINFCHILSQFLKKGGASVLPFLFGMDVDITTAEPNSEGLNI